MPLDGELTSILNSTVSWTSWRITLEFLFGASTDLKVTDTQQDKNEKVCFALSWCVCYPGARLKATLCSVLSFRHAPSFTLINYSNSCQSSFRTYFEHLFLTCQYLSPLLIYKPLNKLNTFWSCISLSTNAHILQTCAQTPKVSIDCLVLRPW